MANKRITITEMNISDKKEGILNRADISFVAAKYTPGSSQFIPLAMEPFYKLKHSELNEWITLIVDIAPASQPLKPGEKIAFVLYEKDPPKSGNSHAYTPDQGITLYYNSKESEYGFIQLPYGDFVPNGTRTYNLTGASIKITSYDV